MTAKTKLIISTLIVLLIFVIATFSKFWGPARSESLLTKYKPIVASLENNPKMAKEQCDAIIKSLKKHIPDLQKSQEKNQDLMAFKLIADCSFASKNYADAAEYYEKLANAEPQVGKWHGFIAEAHFKKGDTDSALKPSILATQLAPQDFKIRLLSARVLAKLQLNNRAISAYLQAIKIAPFDQLANTQQELEQFKTHVSDEK